MLPMLNVRAGYMHFRCCLQYKNLINKKETTAMKWKNLSIQTKIIAICCGIIFCFIATLVIYVMPNVESAIYDMKKEKIKDIVDTTVTTIEGMYQEYLDKAVTEAELKENVIQYATGRKARTIYGSMTFIRP
jgi:hypothetical protein